MRADLHTHSIYSDGYYTPDELCRRAKENGVELLSVTDHDTLNGEEEKRAAAEKYGLCYVSGWEISAYSGESKIHITGYNCKRNAAYEKFMRERVELGFERAEDSIRKLRGAGIYITLDDAKARRADPASPVHTMHIAQAAAEVSGKTAGEIYEEYLAPEKNRSFRYRTAHARRGGGLHTCFGRHRLHSAPRKNYPSFRGTGKDNSGIGGIRRGRYRSRLYDAY